MFALLLKELFVTEGGVVPYGDCKKSPRTPCIVHIIFSFWSFEISGTTLRNQKFMIDLNSFSKQIVYI